MPGPDARSLKAASALVIVHSTKTFFCPGFPTFAGQRAISLYELYLEFWGSFPVCKTPAGLWALSVIREIAVRPCSDTEQTPGRWWVSLGCVGADPDRGLRVQVLWVLSRCLACCSTAEGKQGACSAVFTHTCPPFLAGTPGLCLGVSALPPESRPLPCALSFIVPRGCCRSGRSGHLPCFLTSGVWAFSGSC